MTVAPARYRKKPVTVEIVWFREDVGVTPEEIAAWCGGRVINNLGHPSGKVAIVIPTLEGDMTAQYGDGIVKGVNDEFYPIKPDIAAKTYDRVEDEP